MNKLTFAAAKQDSGQRLDRFLAAQMPETSRARIQDWIASGRVLLDGAEVKASDDEVGHAQIAEADAQPRLKLVLVLPPEENLTGIRTLGHCGWPVKTGSSPILGNGSVEFQVRARTSSRSRSGINRYSLGSIELDARPCVKPRRIVV